MPIKSFEAAYKIPVFQRRNDSQTVHYQETKIFCLVGDIWYRHICKEGRIYKLELWQQHMLLQDFLQEWYLDREISSIYIYIYIYIYVCLVWTFIHLYYYQLHKSFTCVLAWLYSVWWAWHTLIYKIRNACSIYWETEQLPIGRDIYEQKTCK